VPLAPNTLIATSITPPGIKIYASTLIQPAQSNAQATVSGGQISFTDGALLAILNDNVVSAAAERAGLAAVRFGQPRVKLIDQSSVMELRIARGSALAALTPAQAVTHPPATPPWPLATPRLRLTLLGLACGLAYLVCVRLACGLCLEACARTAADFTVM